MEGKPKGTLAAPPCHSVLPGNTTCLGVCVQPDVSVALQLLISITAIESLFPPASVANSVRCAASSIRSAGFGPGLMVAIGVHCDVCCALQVPPSTTEMVLSSWFAM